MPTLAGIVEQGVCGELLAPNPPVPVARWVSVATGKRAWQHGVLDDASPAGHFAARSGTADSRQARALWEILADAGRRSLVVGWPTTHGSECAHSIIVSDRYP